MGQNSGATIWWFQSTCFISNKTCFKCLNMRYVYLDQQV